MLFEVFLSNDETYAIILKDEDKPVGGIDLMRGIRVIWILVLMRENSDFG